MRSNNLNIKKIEKLKNKIAELDKVIETSANQIQTYKNEIKKLEADFILDVMKTRKISLEELEESFELVDKIKKSGLKTDDIVDLIGPASLKENTLYPTDTKSKQEETKNV